MNFKLPQLFTKVGKHTAIFTKLLAALYLVLAVAIIASSLILKPGRGNTNEVDDWRYSDIQFQPKVEPLKASNANITAINPSLLDTAVFLVNRIGGSEVDVTTVNDALRLVFDGIKFQDVAKASPIPVFLNSPHLIDSVDSSRFGAYNPEFIEWAEQHIDILFSDEQFVTKTKDTAVEKLGKFSSLLVNSRNAIESSPEQEALLDYLAGDYASRQNLSDFQRQRFNNLASEHGVNLYYWARRYRDGTQADLFRLLIRFRTAYKINQIEWPPQALSN